MLKQDLDLKVADIQSLANFDAIVALFASLGYNTAARVKQTSEAMALDSLSGEIKRIERIADQEQGYLQIYLIELKKITIANTQKLAQAFKRRAGIFLLVLTTDYDRLDFVLINPAELVKQQPEQTTTIGLKTNRPRILTIRRTNPDIVALRVLRRFSYTEADVEYQLDKLSSAYDVADWAEPFFNNRALFSDYYLNERLKDTPEWSENALPVLRSFEQRLLNARTQLGREPAATLRSVLILPALEQMGFQVQPLSTTANRAQNPDYLLFDPRQPDQPIACCNVYAWDRNLDGLVDDARDPDYANENPGARVIGVLENEANPEWAVVTNGKFWRLYTRRAHSRAANYYEIDLEETLASPDPGLAFRYFWLFFRAAAFSPMSRKGESFLAWLLAECNQYARQLETRLKERIFEEIFPYFAEGFITHMGGASVLLSLPVTEREQKLLDTFHGTLTFLYRLLFLFYAEARNLLPVSEVRGYWDKSLALLKKDIADKAGSISDEVESKLKQEYGTDSYELYDRLFRLFNIIDLGESSVNVPTYNGGLFVTNPNSSDDSPDGANARFLAAHKIPNRFLALGLDRMARDIDARRGDLVMIDYKSLGVQQLGSIYEGLLEFKLCLATEKMAVVRGKKTEEVVPYSEAQKTQRTILRKGRSHSAPEWVLPRGAVYLENDRAERKATGSYYTPDYIVKYIVRNTVGPVLDEKFESLRPRMREVQKTYFKAVERRDSFRKIGKLGDDPKKTFNTPESQSLVDGFFDLRVLDPAMGSGHFLVEAVDFITDRMLAFLNAFPDNPITHALMHTRQTILEEMQHQNISIDPARLTNVNLLKRHVLKCCIFGVDLNRMAVELAKVSLWLHCFTLGAPLSFLDHHLKQGNSLIGARIEEVRAALDMAAEKDTLEIPLLAGLMGSQFAGVMLAVDLMRQIGELPDTTVDQVRKSRTEFRKAADALAPYRRILDVYTSRWFGNPDGKFNQPVLQFLRDERHIDWLKNPEIAQTKLNIADRQLTAVALQASQDKHFFHWELEFPEVFFGPSSASHQQIVLKENPGFDVVVGNPPYGVVFTLQDKEFLSHYFISGSGLSDSYTLFIERSILITKKRAITGLIVPNSLLSLDQFADLRKDILEKVEINQIVNLIENVFPDVTISVMIVLYRTSKFNDEHEILVFNPLEKVFDPASALKLASNWHKAKQSRFLDSNDYQINIELSENEWTLIEKLYRGAIFVEQLLDAKQGVKTGNKEKFLYLDSNAAMIPIDKRKYCKPAVSGANLDRYGFISNEILIYDVQSMLHEASSSPRHTYENKFIQPKIFLQHIRNQSLKRRLILSYDDAGYYPLESVYILCPVSDVDLYFILAILNSTLLDYVYSKFNTSIFITGSSVGRLPIRRIAFNTPIEKRKALVVQAQAMVTTGDESSVLTFVLTRLNTQPEESDVVHDLLAYLAGQMIDLNKQKQAEIKRFLAWLEGILQILPDAKTGHAGLEALSPKDRLKNYLGDYQKKQSELSYLELESILERNKNKLGISLNDARLTARLRQEYEASLVVLRPLKERLAWTDWLIDQIVYQLYGLSEEEIQVIAGSQDQPAAPHPQSPESDTGRIVLANTADAALFLDILQELAQGQRSLVELAARLAGRNPLKNFPNSLIEEMTRELRGIGWVEQTPDGSLGLSTANVPSLLLTSSTNAQQLHLELALAHERKTQMVSKLLNRLLALAPQRMGALVIPEPETNPPADVNQLPKFVRQLVGELVQRLGQDYPATSDLLDAEHLAQAALAKLVDIWNTLPPSKRSNRLTEVVRDGFAQAFFDPLTTPKELIFTWAPRLAQAGLWMWARRLYDTAGITLFPVGLFFRDVDARTGKPIPPAVRKGFKQVSETALQVYQIHEPQDDGFAVQFTNTLFSEVQALRGPELREYVSLLECRDRVCYRLRIGNPVFERLLTQAIAQSVARQIHYSISIEPDRTWQEQSSREMELPVMINGPRYIISMKERVSQ